MKKIFLSILFVFTLHFLSWAQQEPVYYEVAKLSVGMDEAAKMVQTSLQESGFKIVGDYQPAASAKLKVICYTSDELEKTALSFEDRGALAAVLKIGLKSENGSVKVSMLNPMYLFYAYFVDGIDRQEQQLRKISDAAKNAMKKVGSDFVPFGGMLDKNKLQKYHYKVMMPYFSDAEKLQEFASFEEGLKIIQANLSAGKANTSRVYELVYPDKKVAVFGVALQNPENGEAKFLPIIGDDHLAALPYEMILQGNTASILPGRYRIALHWPELTMGTFMKIMSTPGDIADTLKELTK